MSQYFPKPFNSHFGDGIKVKIDLSNYATKTDIKNISHFNTSSFALKTNLASDFVLKTKSNTDKPELKNKIPDVTSFVKKTKSTELENKIPDISNLATKTALTTVENKIASVSDLVKETDYNTNVTEIDNKLNDHNHDNYIATSEFNKLDADVFNARIVQANLITKTDFDAKLSSLNRKITQNETMPLKIKYLMLAVLLKKQNITLNIAEIDTKV